MKIILVEALLGSHLMVVSEVYKMTTFIWFVIIKLQDEE